MAVTQKVTLYNNKFTVPPVINAVQNDTDRQVEAYFGDFTLQVGMTGKLSFIRSDGTHYEVSATLNTGANTATAELDQALTQAGVTQAQLKITDSGNVGSTFTFMIKVQPDVAGISVPQDGWSAQEFDQRLTDAENAIDAVEEDVADLQDKEYDYAPVITDTISGAIASFPDGANGYPLKECVVNIEAVQGGTGDPSPTNVRPISGWSSAKVTRSGKNLIDIADKTLTSEGYIFNQNFDFPSGQYVLSYYSTTPNNKGAMVVIGKDDQSCAVSLAAFESRIIATFNAPNGIKSMRVYNGAATYTNIQLELGSTATEYEPYNGQTVAIDLDGTRYGCTLDVRRGKLRVTHKYWTSQGTEKTDWASSGGGGYYTQKNYGFDSLVYSDDGYCNMFIFKYSFGQTNGIMAYANRIQVSNSSFSTIDEFFDAITATPIQLVYPLATPIEVDLTPTEITTLLGINNVWSDTGDIEVEYCADTKRYIQKVISQLA